MKDSMSTRGTDRDVLDDTPLIATLRDRDRPAVDRPTDQYLCYLRIVLLRDVEKDRVSEKRGVNLT